MSNVTAQGSVIRIENVIWGGGGRWFTLLSMLDDIQCMSSSASLVHGQNICHSSQDPER